MCFKKLTFIFLACGLFLTGCSNSYTRDTGTGEIVDIGLEKVSEMMVQGKTYTIVLTTTMCGYCKEFKEMLSSYLEDHNVTVYNVILDNEPRSQQENLDIIYRYFEDFSTTPGVFYVKDGEAKSQLNGVDGTIREEAFDEWVVKYKMDEAD